MMSKSTSINLRIAPEFREEIEQLAAYHGLSMSSYVHSILVKAMRAERASLSGELPAGSMPAGTFTDKIANPDRKRKTA